MAESPGEYSTGADSDRESRRRGGSGDLHFMRIVVGLGNPGKEYAGTRHNAGFMVLAELAKRHAATTVRSRFRAELTEYFDGAEKVVMVAPMTFMNLSGVAVNQVVQWYRCPLDNVMIVYDDLDIPFGVLRMRESGSAGGHNGLKSIGEELGTLKIPRLRVGIGRGPGVATAHVLARFSQPEQQVLPEVVTRAADAVELWIRKGSILAMNEVNARPAITVGTPETATGEKQA